MSDRPRLWLPRKVSDATIARAKTNYDVILNEADGVSSAEQIIDMSRQVDAIMPCHSEIFSADVVEQLDPRLKILANHSVGTDHCDLTALKAKGIVVTNTPDVLSDATAEIAMLLMLGAARRAVEGDRLVRSGKWDFWSPSFMVGKQVSGARLGIIGMGRVGKAFAKKARGFDMEIHYYNRSRLPDTEESGATYHATIESLLSNADFLSLHCPATPETRHLLNTETIALLPDSAIVINTARGALVDETALLAALNSGKLTAAGLDCFETEPGGNPEFSVQDNIFMLPHIGSATVRTRDAMGFRALDNLDAFFAGREPRDLL
ncbi:2-hydroxyacid dehydrogenase [Roseibium polysiphoniae]|uniref:D-glycerate dehydrogenase n=1 Tax=Roseibium polysiphoniae TaxID=2571221 RepID=A0ABR9CDX3_9HYPH|nr:D-glycerate dehydrogenase [Roseibium polysiphoniae]MBD8878097.1 D-glycerate dehydrogenase [Roseibium polysiphoniae]